jgi:site-specific DNA-cytosine methylase
MIDMRPDVLNAGFPCAAYSQQGKRDNEAATKATERIERTLAPLRTKREEGRLEAMPTWIVLENVVALRSHFPQQWHRLNALLDEMPYVWAHQSIDPHKHLGLPARRPRLYYLGIRRDAYEEGGGGETFREEWASAADRGEEQVRKKRQGNESAMMDVGGEGAEGRGKRGTSQAQKGC